MCMPKLIDIVREAENKKLAVAHFNISDTAGLKAIFEAAREISEYRNIETPVIIGTSEGEAQFLGRRQAAALIKSLRDEYNFPIFLNSDHTRSLDEVKKAVEAGYDAILFDAGNLSLQENIKKTKEAVQYIKLKNPEILVEGELGYIGASSKILKEIPQGAAVRPEDLTKPEEAEIFVKETGVDLLAPAVGNLHGILSGASNLRLDVSRIREIKSAVKIPLVLHGGSGVSDKDFLEAMEAGVSIIHINTELRLAWRRGLEEGLRKNPEEIAPYKILSEAFEEMKKIAYNRLKLFNRI